MAAVLAGTVVVDQHVGHRRGAHRAFHTSLLDRMHTTVPPAGPNHKRGTTGTRPVHTSGPGPLDGPTGPRDGKDGALTPTWHGR
jgi:hypothetical protein